MTTGWGQLDSPPAEAGWEFPAEEYRRRLAGARARMAALGLDCLFLTGEKNIRYLTGFHTQIWVSPTRPRYVVLPLEGGAGGDRARHQRAGIPADELDCGRPLLAGAAAGGRRREPGGGRGTRVRAAGRARGGRAWARDANRDARGRLPADPRRSRRDAARGCEPSSPAAAHGQERDGGGRLAQEEPAMPKTQPWHASDEPYHHDNTRCESESVIPRHRRLSWIGGKPLCPACAQLDREGK